MDTKKLRQKILDLAIRGKLVPQDPNDEPASVLLERIKDEKERLIQGGKIKRPKKSTADTSHYQNWPFEIPESWEWVRLKDIAVIGTGSTPKTTNRDYYGGNIPWINSSSTKYEYVETPNDYITEKALKETNCQLYPIGTVVIAMYGEGKTRGQVCELSIASTTNQACAAIIPFVPTTKAYIKLFFKGNYYAIRTLAEGGLQPNLNIGKISDFWIPLPPEEEQVRIIAEANKWLSIISKIESEQSDMSSIVQETKMKVLDLAIHGRLVPQDSTDEPAIELLRRISPGIKIPCDNPHYQKLPVGWSMCRLEDIVDYEQPQAYIVESTDYSDDYDIPVLTAGKTFIIGYTNEETGICDNLPVIIFDDFTTDSKYVEFPFKVKSSAMKILRVRRGIDIKYVAAFMAITRLIGKTHKRYWISEYSKIEIPIPPQKEQERIIMAIDQITARLNSITTML